MISELIYNFIIGAYEIEINGGFYLEFFQFCKMNNIPIKKMYKTDVGFRLTILSIYKKIFITACNKTGMKYEIIKAYGIPFLIFNLKNKLGIIIGLVLSVLITAILSSMIWDININKLNYISEESIINILNEEGIYIGCFKNIIDVSKTEFILEKRIKNIIKADIYILGSRIFVNITEGENFSNNQQAKEKYSNIVASKDGEIIRSDIFIGEGKLLPGTAVVKGDLLVSGVINFYDGRVKFVNSKANIWARTNTVIESHIDLNIKVLKINKYKIQNKVNFFNLIIKNPFEKKYNNKSYVKYLLKSNDLKYPIGFTRDFYFNFKETILNLSNNQAKNIIFCDYALRSLYLYSQAKILNYKIDFKISNSANIIGNYMCVENIALSKEFFVE